MRSGAAPGRLPAELRAKLTLSAQHDVIGRGVLALAGLGYGLYLDQGTSVDTAGALIRLWGNVISGVEH